MRSCSHYENFQSCENLGSKRFTVADPGCFMLNIQKLSPNYYAVLMQLHEQKEETFYADRASGGWVIVEVFFIFRICSLKLEISFAQQTSLS